MILRLLNAQGMVGIAVSLSLAILLTLSKIETHHWRKQSAAFEQRYRDDRRHHRELPRRCRDRSRRGHCERSSRHRRAARHH